MIVTSEITNADNNIVINNLEQIELLIDETMTEDLGALAGDDRNFTINGNGKALDGDNKYAGIEVKSGDTLTLNNVNMKNIIIGKIDIIEPAAIYRQFALKIPCKAFTPTGSV